MHVAIATIRINASGRCNHCSHPYQHLAIATIRINAEVPNGASAHYT